MRQTCTQQGLEPDAPGVVHRIEPDSLAHPFLLKAEQRLRDMAGARRHSRRQSSTVMDLELKPGVELSEIMQERKNRQPGLGYPIQPALSGRLLKPIPQYRVRQQRLEARRHIRAVVLQAVKARRRFELPPGVATFRGPRLIRRAVVMSSWIDRHGRECTRNDDDASMRARATVRRVFLRSAHGVAVA